LNFEGEVLKKLKKKKTRGILRILIKNNQGGQSGRKTFVQNLCGGLSLRFKGTTKHEAIQEREKKVMQEKKDQITTHHVGSGNPTERKKSTDKPFKDKGPGDFNKKKRQKNIDWYFG